MAKDNSTFQYHFLAKQSMRRGFPSLPCLMTRAALAASFSEALKPSPRRLVCTALVTWPRFFRGHTIPHRHTHTMPYYTIHSYLHTFIPSYTFTAIQSYVTVIFSFIHAYTHTLICHTFIHSWHHTLTHTNIYIRTIYLYTFFRFMRP